MLLLSDTAHLTADAVYDGVHEGGPVCGHRAPLVRGE